MSRVDFLLELYCLIDEHLPHVIPPRGLRLHGPTPKLADAEVLTIELAGEFWGLDADKHLFGHFRDYHRAEFPQLAREVRTTFVRQAANLWALAEDLRVHLLKLLPPGLTLGWLLDSIPIYVCSFARAAGCRLFEGLADYGYDHLQKHLFYGFKFHACSGLGGPLGQFQIAPANLPDVDLAPETQPPAGGMGLGDRAYWDPRLQEELAQEGFVLIAPFRQRSRDPWPGQTRAISRLRQGVETLLGQFAERFNVKWTWARDRWHLCHRIIRKALAHTACVLLNLRHGHPPLQLDRLLD